MATARGKSFRAPDNQCRPSGRREAVDISTANFSPARCGQFRAMWVSATGNVVTIDLDGVTNTTNNVPVGLVSLGGLTVVKVGTTATIDWVELD